MQSLGLGGLAAPVGFAGAGGDSECSAGHARPGGQGAARRSLEDTEMRIRRYPAPVSIQATAADQEVVCLLRRQNELLTEILGVLNAQLAVGLEQFRSGT